MIVLLDTHVWLWFTLTDEKRLGRAARQAVDRALHNGRCALSVVSIWEVATMISRGRFQPEIPPRTWVDRALSPAGLSLEPITRDIAWDSGTLPMHGDPADRLIVATARILDATLVTADTQILGAKGLCKLMPAS